jgi:hypothetical protein
MRISRAVVQTCGAASLAILLTTSAVAQTREASAGRMPAALRAAQELIIAAYPELLERPLEFQARFERGEWLVSVAEAPALQSGQPTTAAAAQPLPVLLRARAAFDAANQLERFAADGPWLFDAANITLRESVRQHPEWSGVEADAELRRLGSRAGSSGAFTPQVAPEATTMARHLGTGVSRGAPQFQWRDVSPGAPPGGRVRPRWVMEVAATRDGAAVFYQLEYEPVGGRLVGITRTGGAQ